MKKFILIALLILVSVLNVKAVKWENYGPNASIYDCITFNGNTLITTQLDDNNGWYVENVGGIYNKQTNSNQWVKNESLEINSQYTYLVNFTHFYLTNNLFIKFKDNLLFPCYNKDSCLISSNSGETWDKIYALNFNGAYVIKDTIYRYINDTIYYSTSLVDKLTSTNQRIVINRYYEEYLQLTRMSNSFFYKSQQQLFKTSDLTKAITKINLPDTTQPFTNLYSQNDKLYLMIGNKIYVSEDLGATFKTFYTTQPESIIRKLYINGSNIIVITSYGSFISHDSGLNYSKISIDSTNIKYLYVDSSEVFCVDFTGLNYSSDNGKTWSVKSNSTLNTNSDYVCGNGSKIVYGNYLDRLTVLEKNNLNWELKETISNPSNFFYIYKLIDSSLFVFKNDQLYKYNINDKTYKECTINKKLYDFCEYSTIKKYDTLLYYISDKGFLRSSDLGDSWYTTGTDAVKGDQMCFNNGYIFVGEKDYRPDPNPERKYSGTGIYRSSNDGANWQLLNNVMKDRPILGLCSKYGNVFASSYGGIYMSSDNGDTWTNISDPRFGLLLGELSVNDDYLFAATGPSHLGIARLKIAKTLGCTQLVFPANSAINVTGNPVLKWNSVDGALIYQVQVAKDIDFNNIVYQGEASDTITKVIGLNLNTKYYWRVKATFGAVKADWCQNYEFTVGGINSIEDLTGEFINVSPNPSAGIIKLDYRFDTEANLNIVVYNVLGVNLYRLNDLKSNGATELDLSTFPVGTYTLAFEINNRRYIKSINIVK